jgi:PAS domain S-box-containing protein
MKKSSQKKRGQQAAAGSGKPAPCEKSLKKRRTLSGMKTAADSFRSIFNAVNDAIFVHDLSTGRILDINRKGCEMFGYSREEILHLTVEDLSAAVRPYTMQNALSKIRRAAVSPQLFEWHAKDKLGRLFWVEVNLKRAAIGGRAKILAVVRDITIRKQTETELERQQNLFRTIFVSTSDLFILKDRNSVYQAVNPAFCRFIGKREDEIIGKTDFDLFPLAEAEKYRANDVKIMDSGKPQIRIEFVSGLEFKKWMHVTKAPVLDDRGASVGILVSVRDITDWKLAEEELRRHRDQLDALVRAQTAGIVVANENLQREIAERRQAEERLLLFRSLIDHSNEAVFIADPETGRLFDINDRACSSLGYTRDEILAMRVTDFDADIKDERSWQGHYEDMKKRGYMIFESRHRRKDGTVFPVEINVRLVQMEDKSYLIGLARDITERIQAERDLRVMESALAASISGMAFGDLDGRLTYVNDAFLKMWGYENASDVLGKPGNELAKLEEQATEIHQALLGKGSWFGDIVAKKKDGSFFDVHLSASLVLDKDGNPMSLMASFVDITDRKRAEDALRKSEERLRQAVSAANIGILDHDHLTDTIYWSPELREIYGWDGNETVTLPAILDHIYPEDHEKVASAVRRSHDPAGDGLCYVENRIIRRDGAIRWLTMQSQTYFGGKGDNRYPVRTVGAVRDVTERLKTEDALRKSEEKYRSVVENINDIIYRISLKDDPLRGKVEFVSGMVESIVGYQPKGFVEDPELWLRLVHPEDLTRLYETTREILENRQTGMRVYRLRRNGLAEYLWMEDKIVPEIDTNGNLIGYFGVARDITERKKTEEALRQSEEQYRSITETIQDVVFRLNNEGYILYVSPSMESVLAYQRSEVIGEHFSRFIHPDDIQKAMKNFSDLILGMRVVRSDLRVLRAGGDFIYSEVNAVGIARDGVVIEIQGAIHDISERIHAESVLRKSEEMFKKLLYDAPIAISMVNNNGTVEYVNRKHCEVLGYDLNDIPTLECWWSQAYPDDATRKEIKAKWYAMVDRIHPGEEIGPVERRVVCKDGTIRDLELRFTPIEGRIIIAFADITERKRVEETLRRSRDLLDEAQRIAHLGSWEMSVNTLDIAASDETYRIHGLEPRSSGLSLRGVFDLVHPDDRARILEHFDESVKSGVFNDLNYRVVWPDASTHYVHTTGLVQKNDDGTPRRVIGMVQDITEQRLLEQEILDIEDRERRRIGQDIHDGLGQILTAASFKCSILERSLAKDDPKIVAEATELSSMIKMAKEQSRSIVQGIVAIEMGRENIVVALRRLCDENSRYFGIICEFDCREPVTVKDHGAAVHLFRIAQEAMTNAIRHAGANRIVIELERTDTKVRLVVSDNGSGFEDGANQGMGLRIMNYRARLINAKLSIESQKGTGTRITCFYEGA